MHTLPSFRKILVLVALAFVSVLKLSAAEKAPDALYSVQQTVKLTGIPQGAKHINFWVSIPDNERYQDLLDFKVVETPGIWKAVRDADRGNRFLYVECENPSTPEILVKVEFLLRRQSVFTSIDPSKVGSVDESLKRLYREELRTDAPHMEASAKVIKMADEACGFETNVYLQATKLLNAVADFADHYSKDPSKPRCGIGSAGDCMTNAGGCCTDMHSLFIAMARHRGIPARLQMGYRLKESNEGKEVDPGYRCWAEYFVPGYGWISADVVEADDPKGLGRSRWFTGLTERRLWLNEGREFDFTDLHDRKTRINTMIIGHAEIDGVPARVLPDELHNLPAQLSRTILFTQIR